MKKVKRPKTAIPGRSMRVLIIQQLLIAADKRRDYLVACVENLESRSRKQSEELELIYDTLVEMATPRYVKLWRWVKGKVKRCRTGS